jgi:rhamnogalacturonyl hydrolase YesR
VASLAFHQGPAGYEKIECLARWCWCDALFMAPPAWLEMSRQTGDPRYARFAMRELWATVDFLYDPAERLFYRDSRFFDRRDSEERKLFWSRGNGWVFAGLARMIPLLPKGTPDRVRMEVLFRDMAARLVTLQKPDGYWAPSLLAPVGSPPESSGTGFFTYGLAWGIRAGLLDRKAYEPAARRGWNALLRAVQPDGRLGWVQQVSDRPDRVAAGDTQYYGVGAFLLAASAVADLD